MPFPSSRARRRNPAPETTTRSAFAAIRDRLGPRTAQPDAGRRQHLPFAVTISAALLVGAGITAAHADMTDTGPFPAATAPQAAVAPPAEASITFDRSQVGTAPAEAAPEVEPAAAAPQEPAPAPAAVPPAKLSAPVASVSVSSPFGLRPNPITGGSGELHTGLDLVAPCGIAVLAAGSGTVVEAGWHAYGGGNRIVVDHGNGLKSTYNHLSSIETTVGAAVNSGQRLAAAGTTGNSTGCHLHFEVLSNDQAVNPQAWI